MAFAQSADAAPPNIILILADDLGYGHLGSYGQSKIRTANLDRLAAEGVRFTQAYAGSSLCRPSRTALLTGLHTGHTPIRANRKLPLPLESLTVAEILQQAGYRTGLIGKWGYGKAELEWSFPDHHGFDVFFGYLDHQSAYEHYPKTLWKGHLEVEVDGYSHDLFTDAALDFVHNADEPFFLYLAYTLPHPAVEVPGNSLAGYDFEERPYDDYRQRRQDRPRAALAGMVTRLDRAVGTLISTLRERGIAQDTVVLFTSDNGPGGDYRSSDDFFDATGGLRAHKEELYEGGIRVPLIVWWPGRIAPQETDHVIAQWDILPTLAELAGLEVDGDGVSFVPLLHGDFQPQHEYLYWELHGITTAQAVRFGAWKAIRSAPNQPVELYDLDSDPGEMTDLAKAQPALARTALAYIEDAHQEAPEWPLRENTFWTEILRLRERVAAWAREGQAYGQWYGMLADLNDALWR